MQWDNRKYIFKEENHLLNVGINRLLGKMGKYGNKVYIFVS